MTRRPWLVTAVVMGVAIALAGCGSAPPRESSAAAWAATQKFISIVDGTSSAMAKNESAVNGDRAAEAALASAWSSAAERLRTLNLSYYSASARDVASAADRTAAEFHSQAQRNGPIRSDVQLNDDMTAFTNATHALCHKVQLSSQLCPL